MKSQQQVTDVVTAAHDLPFELANQENTFFVIGSRSGEDATSASIFKRKRSMVKGSPDVGILSKDFFKKNGQEEQSVDKQFVIHRKKRAVAVDVDVGILSNGRRQQASRVNLHDKNEVAGRSLQSEEEFPFMCPGKNGWLGYLFFANLFNETYFDFFTEEGYFPKCSCPSPTTCGPVLCECL